MRQIVLLMAGVLLALSAGGAEIGITVSDAWAHTTAPGQDIGSLQLSIMSDKAATLVAVSSPLAGAVEIHHMTHENGTMKMRRVESIILPAGKLIDLSKNGNHLMLLDLKGALKMGDRVPVTLTVEFADKRKASVNVKAEVRSQTTTQDIGHMHDMKGM